MNTVYRVAIVFCCWSAMCIGSAAGADDPRSAPNTLIATQLEPIPLEYQAVVFRRIVRNDTNSAFYALYPEYGVRLASIQRPDETVLPFSDGGVQMYSQLYLHGYSEISRVPLELKPRYQCSITFASAIIWKEQGIEPLLREAGSYIFHFERGDPLEFVVRAAKGRDK